MSSGSFGFPFIPALIAITQPGQVVILVVDNHRAEHGGIEPA
jgi:hypothetical protein